MARPGRELSLARLAEASGAELHGDPAARVRRVAPLDRAGPGDLAFLSDPRYRQALGETRAGAVILPPEALAACPCAALVSTNPSLAYARAAAALYPREPVRGGIHPSAVVEPGAQVDASAWVGPLCVVEAGARIGPRVFLGPGCLVGAGVRIGADSRLIAQVVVLYGVEIGRRALIHPGAVLGREGFGFARDGERWVRIPQVGGLRLGDDVEIGVNTAVDRGAIDDTRVEDGVILDSLIQIGHNCRIGAHTAVAACTGVSGSVDIGRDCTLGGAVGVAGHLRLADGVHVAAGGRVTKSLDRPGLYGGVMPVEPDPAWRRNVARIRQLDRMARRLQALERRLGAEAPP